MDINIDSINNWQQVDIAIKIRNCIAHSSGLLDFMNNKEEIKSIVKNGLYLPKKILSSKNGREAHSTYLAIERANPLGDKLIIGNEYAWHACVFLSEFFHDLCEQVIQVLSAGNRNS
jgi:hypothetical protein